MYKITLKTLKHEVIFNCSKVKKGKGMPRKGIVCIKWIRICRFNVSIELSKKNKQPKKNYAILAL